MMIRMNFKCLRREYEIGQPEFRRILLKAYNERCCISGTGPSEVLEAVHILEHSQYGINETQNGLLLRSDLHCLFDSGLLRIEPSTLQVHIADSLVETDYWKLNGVQLRPRVDGSHISTDYLKQRLQDSSG